MCFKENSVAFQFSFFEVSRIFNGSFNVFRKCFKKVSSKFSRHFKGEHWCKTLIKGMQDWGKTKTSASAVFEKNVLYKRNKPPKIKNLHFLTSLLVAGMNFARS